MQNIAKVAQLSKFILIMTVSERPRSCWGPTQLARGSPLKQALEISSTASRVNNQELALMSLPTCWVMKATSITATEFYGSVIPSNLYVPVNEWVASSRILVFTHRFLESPQGKHCNSLEGNVWRTVVPTSKKTILLRDFRFFRRSFIRNGFG